MSRWCALLRGINVGGKHRVAMADLLAVARDLGFADTSTYIQSGNLLFSFDADEAMLCLLLSDALEEAFGFSIPVVLRSGAALDHVLKVSPFDDAPANLVMVAFCEGAVPEVARMVDPASVLPEAFFIDEREVHLSVPLGMARSTLPKKLGLLPPPTTIRNLATVKALVQRCDGRR